MYGGNCTAAGGIWKNRNAKHKPQKQQVRNQTNSEVMDQIRASSFKRGPGQSKGRRQQNEFCGVWGRWIRVEGENQEPDEFVAEAARVVEQVYRSKNTYTDDAEKADLVSQMKNGSGMKTNAKTQRNRNENSTCTTTKVGNK